MSWLLPPYPKVFLAGLIHHPTLSLTANLIIHVDMVESFSITGMLLKFNLLSVKTKELRQLPKSHNIARFKKIKTLRQK